MTLFWCEKWKLTVLERGGRRLKKPKQCDRKTCDGCEGRRAAP